MEVEGELCDNDLHVAVRLSDVDATLSALNEGFNPDTIGLYEWSSVHEASYNGDDEILKILIKHGADVNKQDLLNGNTALHYAANENHYKCLQILLGNGADCKIVNKKNESPGDVVTESSCKELLRKHGCVSKKDRTVKSILKANKESKTSSNSFPKPVLTSSPVKIKMSKVVIKEKLYFEEDSSEDSEDISSTMKELSLRNRWDEKYLHLPSSPARSVGSSYGSMTSLGSSSCSAADDCAGQFLLSFEYNKKKENFKVRVWEIGLITLLPPSKLPKNTTIHFYIKTVLIPVNQFASNPDLRRKSEVFRLGSDEHERTASNCLTSSTWGEKEARLEFKSSISLEYSNMKNKLVEDCSIQICLCIQRKQRLLLSNKPKISSDPVLASVDFTMKEAVKKIMKESYDAVRHDVVGVTRQAIPLDGVISDVSGHDNRSFNSDPSVHIRVTSLSSSNEMPRSSSVDDLRSLKIDQSRSYKSTKKQSHLTKKVINQTANSSIDLTSEEGRDSGIDKSGTYSFSSLDSVVSHASATNPEISIRVPSKKTHTLTSVKIDKHNKSAGDSPSVTLPMPRNNPAYDSYAKQAGERSKVRVTQKAKTKLKSVIRPNTTMVTALDDEERSVGSPTEEDPNSHFLRGHTPHSMVEVDESPSKHRPRRPKPFLYTPEHIHKTGLSPSNHRNISSHSNKHLVLNVDQDKPAADLEVGVTDYSANARRRIDFNSKTPRTSLSTQRVNRSKVKAHSSRLNDLNKLVYDETSLDDVEMTADNPCYVND